MAHDSQYVWPSITITAWSQRLNGAGCQIWTQIGQIWDYLTPVLGSFGLSRLTSIGTNM